MMSSRIRKFNELVRVAHDMPTDWLVAALQDKTRNNGHMTAISRLACLRVLIYRNYGIEPWLRHHQRKKGVLTAIGI